MYKIIGADLKEYGPVSADQLRQWIAEGRVNAQTKVQAADATDWRAVGELPEFAPHLPRIAPPLPPAPLTLPHPATSRTNQMALWSMISGIFCLLCCQILSPLPIALGAVALTHLRSHPDEEGSGFAITGIVLGALAVLMCVIGILIVLSTPDWLNNLKNQMQQQ